MRPVIKNNDYQPAVNTRIGSQVQRASIIFYGVQPTVPNGYNFQTAQLLNLMQQKTVENDGQPDWGGLPPMSESLMTYLIKVYTNNVNSYKLARRPLIEALGQFCSYCGMRVNDTSLAVEHVLPKSEFPSLIVNYDNLLLACTPCNSMNKGANPTYADGMVWSGINNPTFVEVVDSANDHYWWPDMNNDEVYDDFVFNLYDDDGDEVPIAQATAADATIADIEDGEVNANINGNLENNVTAEVETQGNRAEALVELVGMDEEVSEKFTDRRMLNRTVAWFHAVGSWHTVNYIAQLPQSPQRDAALNASLQQLYSSAASSGFYSVWVRVLLQLSPPAPNSIYNLFKAATAADNQYFPGTNDDLLP